MNEATAKEEVLARFSETIGQMSRDLADWIPTLRRLAEIESLRTLALGQCSEITGSNVRAIIATRRLRDEHFWPAMSESAWAILLELLANRLEGERRGVDYLAEATELSADSALHWVDWLIGRGIVFRTNPAAGPELVDLRDAGADRMHTFLLDALRLSPWVL